MPSSHQDEPSTLQLLKKHLVLEQTIEDYAETIGLLSQQCRQLLEMGHPDWSDIFLFHIFSHQKCSLYYKLLF